ncbi:MAG TPA: hypothetical protein VIU63_07225 [Nitrospira sp.]
MALDNRVFLEFSQHIVNQVHQDKQAFARASTCLSWFYKASKTPVPPAQGIVWRPAALQPETDCPRRYPGGMNAARDDFARTQTLLSVSLTVYQFALVADLNDDYAYNAAELQDLFSSLSLTLDTTGAHPPPVAALTERFDHWYRIRNLEEVMKGMNALYERGYRVTADDRAELDRVMK